MLTQVLKFFYQMEGKIAIRTALAASIGLLIGTHVATLTNRPDSLISGLWCTLTAIIVLQAHLGGTYTAAWNRFFGVLIGSFMGGLLTSLLGSDAVSLGIGVFGTVLLSTLLGLSDGYRIASVSCAVVTVLWGLRPEISPWIFSFYRFLDSCVGILIAVAIAHLLWPYQVIEKIRHLMADVIEKLDQLFQIALIIEPQKKTYEEYVESINSSLRETLSILEESKSEFVVMLTQFDKWMLLIDDVNHVLESLLSLCHVYKESTQKIFDISLYNQIRDTIDKIHVSFQEISKRIKTGKEYKPLPDLACELDRLKEELNRFRSTHTTRGFNLEDVENYFVFCYSLKNILELLHKIQLSVEELTIA